MKDDNHKIITSREVSVELRAEPECHYAKSIKCSKTGNRINFTVPVPVAPMYEITPDMVGMTPDEFLMFCIKDPDLEYSGGKTFVHKDSCVDPDDRDALDGPDPLMCWLLWIDKCITRTHHLMFRYARDRLVYELDRAWGTEER